MARKLTPNQKRFVEEYLKCWNATETVRRAYQGHYSEKARRVTGSRLIKNEKIQMAIEKALNKNEITAEGIERRLMEIAEHGGDRTRLRALIYLAKAKGLMVSSKGSEPRPNSRPETIIDLDAMRKSLREAENKPPPSLQNTP